MEKILILSIERRASYEIAVASKSLSKDIKVIGMSNYIDNPHALVCDELFVRDFTISYELQILELCSKTDPDIILSGTEDDNIILAKLNIELKKLGVVFPGTTYEKSLIVADKLLTYELLSKTNIPLVYTYDLKNNDCMNLDYPLILKPRYGSGSLGVFIVKNEQEFRRIRNVLSQEEYIVQQFLYDYKLSDRIIIHSQKRYKLLVENEFSIQIIFGPSSNIAGIFCSENILQMGSPVVVNTIIDHELINFAKKCAKELKQIGMIGPVNLQAKQIRKGQFCIFEINCRCTGITGLRAILGFNEVELLTNEFVHNISKKTIINKVEAKVYRTFSNSILKGE